MELFKDSHEKIYIKDHKNHHPFIPQSMDYDSEPTTPEEIEELSSDPGSPASEAIEESSSNPSTSDEIETSLNDVGPSTRPTKRKRKELTTMNTEKPTKIRAYQDKAAAIGIDFDMVCSNPKIKYLRRCINKINRSLSEKLHQNQLNPQGDKTKLLRVIFDYLGVPEDERCSIPLSTSHRQNINAITFTELDFGYKRARQWIEDHEDTSSIKSFDDCICSRCDSKARRPFINQNVALSSKTPTHSKIAVRNQNVTSPTTPMPPKIPAVRSIEGAIQQAQPGGIIDEIYRLYKGTGHWKNLKKIYSERKILYTQYQQHGNDLKQLLNFYFKDGDEGERTYKNLINRIGQINAQKRVKNINL